MAIYHLRENGDPGRCKAEFGNCPFGGPADHYITREAAARAYELHQAGSFDGEDLRALAMHQLDAADTKLLHHALRLATATPQERREIEVKTDAIAIVRAVQVDRLMSISL